MASVSLIVSGIGWRLHGSRIFRAIIPSTERIHNELSVQNKLHILVYSGYITISEDPNDVLHAAGIAAHDSRFVAPGFHLCRSFSRKASVVIFFIAYLSVLVSIPSPIIEDRKRARMTYFCSAGLFAKSIPFWMLPFRSL